MRCHSLQATALQSAPRVRLALLHKRSPLCHSYICGDPIHYNCPFLDSKKLASFFSFFEYDRFCVITVGARFDVYFHSYPSPLIYLLTLLYISFICWLYKMTTLTIYTRKHRKTTDICFSIEWNFLLEAYRSMPLLFFHLPAHHRMD